MDPSQMGPNMAMLSSMQNAGASAMAASQRIKLFHFLAELDYHCKFDLSTLTPMNKQIMPGAGAYFPLPCMNPNSLMARILGEILQKLVSRDEFIDALGGMEDFAADVAAAHFEETDLNMLKAMTAQNFTANDAATRMIDI